MAALVVRGSPLDDYLRSVEAPPSDDELVSPTVPPVAASPPPEDPASFSFWVQVQTVLADPEAAPGPPLPELGDARLAVAVLGALAAAPATRGIALVAASTAAMCTGAVLGARAVCAAAVGRVRRRAAAFLAAHARYAQTARRALVVVKQVELVSRGYRISSAGLAPIARIEQQTKERHCVAVRTGLAGSLATLERVLMHGDGVGPAGRPDTDIRSLVAQDARVTALADLFLPTASSSAGTLWGLWGALGACDRAVRSLTEQQQLVQALLRPHAPPAPPAAPPADRSVAEAVEPVPPDRVLAQVARLRACGDTIAAQCVSIEEQAESAAAAPELLLLRVVDVEADLVRAKDALQTLKATVRDLVVVASSPRSDRRTWTPRSSLGDTDHDGTDNGSESEATPPMSAADELRVFEADTFDTRSRDEGQSDGLTPEQRRELFRQRRQQRIVQQQEQRKRDQEARAERAQIGELMSELKGVISKQRERGGAD